MRTWNHYSRWKEEEMVTLAYVIGVVATGTLALIVWTGFTIPQFLTFIGA